MSATVSRRRVGYEVEVDCIKVVDAAGLPHWIGRDYPLPDWVSDDQLKALLEAGALYEYRVI